MSLGGLGLMLAHVKNQKPTKPCSRCGQQYVVEENDKCPHCGSKSDRELEQYKQYLEKQHRGNRNLGIKFVVAAMVTLLLMLVLSNI